MKIFYLVFLMMICGILKICLNYKFFMINLLSLEFLVLVLFFFLFLYLNLFNMEFFFLMIFLTFSVCEGVLGISLLVMMIRNYSNNYYQSLSSFLC